MHVTQKHRTLRLGWQLRGRVDEMHAILAQSGHAGPAHPAVQSARSYASSWKQLDEAQPNRNAAHSTIQGTSTGRSVSPGGSLPANPALARHSVAGQQRARLTRLVIVLVNLRDVLCAPVEPRARVVADAERRRAIGRSVSLVSSPVFKV